MNNAQFVMAVRMALESGEFRKAMAGVVSDIKGMKKEGGASIGDTTANMKQLGESSRKLQADLRSIAGSLTAVFAAVRLTGFADEIKLVDARLRIAMGSVTEFNRAMQKSYEISRDTGSGYASIAQLYGRLATTAKDYGLSQDRIANVTEATARAIQLSGTGAAEASSVIRQLSQALGAGVLRGDEFNSIMENGGRLAKALADGLGLPIGRLRELAEAGTLTTDIVSRALESQLDTLTQESAKMPQTVARSMQVLRDEFGKVLRDFNAGLGGTDAISSGIEALADNLRDVLGVVAVTAAGAATQGMLRLSAAVKGTTLEYMTFIAAERAKHAAAIQSAAAEVRASQVALQAAQAHQAAAAAILAEERATLADITALAIYGERRAAASRQVAAAAAAHQAAATATAAAEARLTAATAASGAAMAAKGIAARALSSALGLLGGPIGVITTALTLGITAWAVWGNKAEEAGRKARSAIEAGLDVAQRLRNEKLFGAGDIGTLKQSLEAVNSEIEAIMMKARTAGSQKTLAALEAQKAEIQAAISDMASAGAEVGRSATGIGVEVLNKGMDAFMKSFRSKDQELSDTVAAFRTRAAELAKAGDSAWAEGGAKYKKALADIQASFSGKKSGAVQAMAEVIDESFRLTKDALDRESKSWDQALEDRRVTIAEWYAEKGRIAEASFASEQARLERERAQYTAHLGKLAASAKGAGSADERQRAEGAILKTKGDVAKIDADLIILERQRAETIGNLARDAAEKERQYQAAIEATRTALLRAQGRDLEAQLAEIKAAADKSREMFRGDQGATDLVDQLFDAQTAKAKIDDLQKKVGDFFAFYSEAERQAAARVELGSLTQLDAEAELQALRARSIDQIKAYIVELEALAAATKDPELLQKISAAKIQLQGLEQTQSKLVTDLKNAGQSGLSTFFTDLASGTKTFKEALSDLVRSFAAALGKMAADAIAADIAGKIFGKGGSPDGGGSFLSSALSWFAGLFHTGGIVGSERATGRWVSPLVFAGAPRYHSGGYPGLAPNEVPAILEKGERVQTIADQKAAANQQRGGGYRIVNVVDPSLVADYMTSSSGEQTILNTIGRNPGFVRQIIGA